MICEHGILGHMIKIVNMHGTRQKKMTRRFTPEEKAIMRRAKILLKMKRKQIAILLGAEPKQISNFFHYDSKINLLPPKPKLTKKMLMSKKGRIVRYLALQHPRLPLRDLHHLICSLEAFTGKYSYLYDLPPMAICLGDR